MVLVRNMGCGRIPKIFMWILIIWLITSMALSIHLSMFRLRIPTPSTLYDRSWSFLKNDAGVIDTETTLPDADGKSPSPVVHIGFLKVHKAASTTTQSIFLRFGWRRNLTFILPPEYNSFGYPNIISTNESLTKYNILPPPSGKQFDILCHHAVFGEAEWGHYLPPDSVYVGTVREPFRTFVSTLNYFNPATLISAQRINRSDPVLKFLQNYQKFEKQNVRNSFTNNRQSFEYGLGPDIIRNRNISAFNEYLETVLDRRFKLVIVAERYDESLVLLKRKLNWGLCDILYTVKNVRNQKNPDRYTMKEVHKPLHREFAIFDYRLYEFFNQRLDDQIKEETLDFHDEVAYFTELTQHVSNFCHSGLKRIKSLTIAKTDWNTEFSVTREDCDIMQKGEIIFTQNIRKQQYGSATWDGVRKKVVPNVVKNILNNK